VSGTDAAYRPGPDGKIHIDDGNLRITAERPDGPNGPTVVTVDNGSGAPTTYTLGEEHATAAAGAGSPTRQPDITTMPAPAAGAVPTDATSMPAPADAAVPTDATTMPAPADAAVPADGAVAGLGQGTAPAATGADSLGVIGSSIGGGSEGVVSGSLGDAAALGAGAETGATPVAPVQSAALGVQPAGGADPMAGQQAATAGGMAGMGGMMGGMGGAGGGGGEDQVRSSRSYRIDGGIFNTSGSGGRISGSLDDDGDRSVTQR
jgi:hypothetical protein